MLCAGCSSATGADSRPAPTPGPYVATIVVGQGTIHPTLQIAGVITPYRQVGIAADLSEPIADVDVQEGDRVRSGQALAHLATDDLEAQLASAQRVTAEDVAKYEQAAYQTNATNAQDAAAIRTAQSSLHQAQVNLAGAETDLKRYEGLEAQGYLAPQTVDQQRTSVSSDAAAVNTAQAALNQAAANAAANGRGNNAGVQQAELQSARETADAAQATVEQLRRQIARATIVSPVDGVVDAVNANPGEYPSERQLFTIEQVASVYALLPTSTSQVVQIPTGAPASITVSGSPHLDYGKVVAVLDELQPGTTNFTVKVLVPNADGHLHAGMPVTGNLTLPAVNGIEIPVSAFIDDTHSTVYAVENGIAKTVDVHDVRDDGTNAIVTGIAAGTRIVSDVDSANVGNGDRVNITQPAAGTRRTRGGAAPNPAGT
jgi:HlyD family secretion protein